MKTIVIYYFTGTGNTWWTANHLQGALESSGNRVSCYSIETQTAELTTEQCEEVDHIVIGFPVYGSTAPRPMLEFIDTLPTARKNQSATVFLTQAFGSGDCAYYIGQSLVNKGYDLKQAVHIKMMNNLHLPAFRFYKPKNDERLTQRLQAAKPKIDKLVQAIGSNTPLLVGDGAFGRFWGQMQRRHVDTLIEKISSQLCVDETRCIRCGLCERLCPVQNITKDREGAVSFGENCAACMRCYSQCPKYAVLVGSGSADTARYPRFRGPDGLQFSKILRNAKRED